MRASFTAQFHGGAAGKEIPEQLRAAGYSRVTLETRRMRPVAAVATLGVLGS